MQQRQCGTCGLTFTTARHGGVSACPQCGSLKTELTGTRTHHVRAEKSESGRKRFVFTPREQDYKIQFRCLLCTTVFESALDPHQRYQCPKCSATELHPMSPAAASYPAGNLPQKPLAKAEIKRLRFIMQNYRMIVQFRERIDDLFAFMRRAQVPPGNLSDSVEALERAYRAVDRTHQIKIEDYEKARQALTTSGDGGSDA